LRLGVFLPYHEAPVLPDKHSIANKKGIHLMNQSWFITGTDTEVGKTWYTLAFIQHLKNQGLQVAGMKPIASGSELTEAGLRNSDALQILKTSGLDVPYDWVNPYAFAPPIAPHLAAAAVGQTIELERIITQSQQLAAQAEALVIEGVGGWRVPVNETESLKDIVLALDVPVILVVGLRLGCINHALLSAETIISDGCTLAGWVANPIDPDFDAQASIETIKERLQAPLLAQMPYLETLNINELTQTLQ
jgi:dethiobiotin synthetase